MLQAPRAGTTDAIGLPERLSGEIFPESTSLECNHSFLRRVKSNGCTPRLTGECNLIILRISAHES